MYWRSEAPKLEHALFRKIRPVAALQLGQSLGAVHVLHHFGEVRIAAQFVAAVHREADARNPGGFRTRQIPHALRVTNATLNPAVALAVTERPDSAFSRAGDTKNDKQYSRLSIEVITATLVGAALGGNLYLLLAGRRNTVL